jgi:hypothetical protein
MNMALLLMQEGVYAVHACIDEAAGSGGRIPAAMVPAAGSPVPLTMTSARLGCLDQGMAMRVERPCYRLRNALCPREKRRVA